MNILMITGSPHTSGTSALLADNFMAGAQQKGHTVKRMDAAFLKIHPCTGCEYCRTHEGICVFQDDMSKWMDSIMQADMLIFVTPLYYFGMSAQIKSVIDRFFARNKDLQKQHKQAMLLATCGDEEAWASDALCLHYKTLCRYLHFEDKGILCARAVYQRQDIEATSYPKQAWEFGHSI